MASERIGTCGFAQSSGGTWAEAELALGICYIKLACGAPPDGFALEIVWQDNELGEYPEIGITWDGTHDAPWVYIRRAEAALTRLHEAVDWDSLDPAGLEDEDEAESEDESE